MWICTDRWTDLSGVKGAAHILPTSQPAPVDNSIKHTKEQRIFWSLCSHMDR